MLCDWLQTIAAHTRARTQTHTRRGRRHVNAKQNRTFEFKDRRVTKTKISLDCPPPHLRPEMVRNRQVATESEHARVVSPSRNSLLDVVLLPALPQAADETHPGPAAAGQTAGMEGARGSQSCCSRCIQVLCACARLPR